MIQPRFFDSRVQGVVGKKMKVAEPTLLPLINVSS